MCWSAVVGSEIMDGYVAGRVREEDLLERGRSGADHEIGFLCRGDVSDRSAALSEPEPSFRLR